MDIDHENHDGGVSLKPFRGQFTQQEAISDSAITKAVEVLKTGRLHRYNSVDGEQSVVSSLETAYANYQGAKYCLACASGGYALATSMRAAGIKANDQVLTNAFTLAPVPGAIAAIGAEPVLVDITDDLVLDLNDLVRKLDQTGARCLLLSHMRGHLCDMDRLKQIVDSRQLVLIEDCAHTMGASWNGVRSGNFGLAGCFSTQTYKHMNSGEGGLITSDDPDFMARAIVLSGSYMLYDRHDAAPPAEAFEDIRLETPNMSGRMDNLRAAILLDQLDQLDINIERWNKRYDCIADKLRDVAGIYVPQRPEQEFYVGSSLQFLLPGIDGETAAEFVNSNKALGVELKWFGAPSPVAFTSTHHSWTYIKSQDMARTDRILSGLFDLRIPLTFSIDDCLQIAEIITHNARNLAHSDEIDDAQFESAVFK